MPNSWVSNHIHIVFSTKNRARTISEQTQPKLWAYIAGIAKNHGLHAVAIGGIEDHIHALINLGAVLGIAKTAQLLKANSSRWMNEHARTRFEWQEGYFACSVKPVAGVERHPIHRESKGASQEDGFCHGVHVVAEEAWAYTGGLIYRP